MAGIEITRKDARRYQQLIIVAVLLFFKKIKDANIKKRGVMISFQKNIHFFRKDIVNKKKCKFNILNQNSIRSKFYFLVLKVV